MSLPRQHSVQTNCDSKASLEELFGVLNQPANEGSRPSTWIDRKLPPSFYKEPDSRHGTRSPCGAAVGHQSPKRLATGLQVVHGRSVSSPANLPHSLSAAVIKTTPQHSRQNSFDGFLDGKTASPADAACSPQPANWQERETKFARHSTDGALVTDFTAATVQLQQAAMKQTAMGSGVRSNTNVAVHQLGSAEFSPSPDSLPLPPGWERGTTPDGEVYYIDHNTRSTSWTHPALVTAQNQQTTVQQATHRQFSGSVQPGVQHAQHKANDGTHGRRLSTEQIIQQQLMQIQQDKLRIQRESELILQRERQLSELMRRSAVISSPTLGNATVIDQSGAVGPGSGGAGIGAIMPSQQSAMARSPAIGIGSQHPGGTSGPDGFPVHCGGGGVPSVHSVHARQSSGDSGLGGMGATYTLSRVDDYLCNVDERMDIHEGLLIGLGGGNTFGNQFNGIDLGLADPTIDSEQLVSTLNDLTGDLGSVGDMDIQNTDSLLTWL